MTAHGSAVLLATSLKMYLGPAATERWAEGVAAIARTHPAVVSGAVELAALPSLTALERTRAAIGDAPVTLGAQDLTWLDRGAVTGGVSGADLAEVGCRYAEVGHAERTRIFGEDATIAQAKFAAAVRNGLTPILCVGEGDLSDAAVAAATCADQLTAALSGVPRIPSLVIAYEPVWAIGRQDPAPTDHVAAVVDALRRHVAANPSVEQLRIIYGGSAQPGVYRRLGLSIDGLFLGRFAHDPDALRMIVDEVWGQIR